MTGSPSGDTPAVARQRVRRWLQRSRLDTELTQSDVAKRLGWSLSKIQRIEIGDVAVSETDLRALLDLYGVTGTELVAGLVKDARLARRERWATDPDHRKYLTTGLRHMLQFEVVATQIRSYQPLLLPGVLQTRATAEFIIAEAGRHLTADERRVRLETRMRRRKDVIERPDGPQFYLVIDESVILRNVGGVRITAEQLEDLAEVAAHPKIFIRVSPLDQSMGAIIGTLGNFMLMRLSEEDDQDDTVLYRERFNADDIDHDPEKIRPYRDAFEHLWELSLPEESSLQLIQAAAAGLRARLARLPADVT
jgi:transcriptional regulator with XRE-family HTH domain